MLPPTELYNEGWMLRLVLDYMSRQVGQTHPLAFMPGASWYSEALLPSRFLSTSRVDVRGEGCTYADGLIGNFSIESGHRGEAVLLAEARQLTVIESKMGSTLSAGTRNAPYYDQAARNVACMAHMIHRAGLPLDQFDQLAFYVIAPASRIEMRLFDLLVTKDSIEDKVRRRVAAYEGSQNAFLEILLLLLARIRLEVLSWENILDDLPMGKEENRLREFYQKWLEFNLPRRPLV